MSKSKRKGRIFLGLAIAVIVVAMAGITLSSCAVVDHPTVRAKQPSRSMNTWEEVLAAPPVLDHELVISGRWHVPLSGLLNLDHPKAVEAGLVDKDQKIVLPVHVVTHPKHGVFIIDSGVPKTIQTSGPLVESFVADVVVVEPIEKIVANAEARSGTALSGVFLTHLHLDHVLGLAGLPKDTPIFSGAGETTAEGLMNAVTRSTFQGLLEGRPPIQEWNFDGAKKMGPIAGAIDVFGDGSFWALTSPGHTGGSTAYLAVTKSGPMLFVGDTSHTWWGWDHGVEPGEYTADQSENRRSLNALKSLADAFPKIEVFVGHQVRDEVESAK